MYLEDVQRVRRNESICISRHGGIGPTELSRPAKRFDLTWREGKRVLIRDDVEALQIQIATAPLLPFRRQFN